MDPRTQRILEFDRIVAQLADQAASEPGRELCLALQPSPDLDEVLVRQSETEDAVRVLLEKGVPPLSGISDVRSALARASLGAMLSCLELLRIGAVLRAAARLKGFLPERAEGWADNAVFRILRTLDPLRPLEQALTDAILGEDEVADRASPELASIRRRIREAQAEVKAHLDHLVRSGRYAKALQESLVTQRNGRYVVPVKVESRGEIPGIVHDASSSGATLFVEPMPVVEANNRIRELLADERDEIDRILQDLSLRVGAVSGTLGETLARMARVDFLVARGRLALAMKAMRPQVGTGGRIRLVRARHPLIPANRVVPVDFWIGDTFRTLLVTGPNTGGKTVALKTCGLLTLMGLSGLQIPAADGSEISVFDSVMADIGDEQSIDQDLSTFSSHMRSVVRIVAEAGDRSLVLLDELGSGTDPAEGAALAMSILEHLRGRGAVVVATTHYKELKSYALRTGGVENACCEFDSETLRPTFRLLIGVPGVSNAFAISRRLGLPDSLIEAASRFMTEEGVRFEELVRRVEARRVEAERDREEASALLARANQDAATAAKLRNELEQKKADILRRAREEARETLRQTVDEVDGLLESIREARNQADAQEAQRLADEVRQTLRTRLGDMDREIGRMTLQVGESVGGMRPDRIQAGDSYLAPSLGLVGRVESGPDARGQVRMAFGSMRASVPAASLRIPPSDNGTADRAARSGRAAQAARGSGRDAGTSRPDSVRYARKSTFLPEIQLLGMTVEEATDALDKYLDDAVLAGYAQIRIVHGKGTGALRSAVHALLKQDRRVRTFRIGAYGEGDSGVTLAEL